MNRHLFEQFAAANLTRRGFLGGSLALAAAPVTRPLFGDPLPALSLINLNGGNDGLNTLIPTGLAAYQQIRSSLAIPPAAGASLDGGPAARRDYVLHPALANLARMYREGQVAIIRCVGYPESTQSHFTSRDIWSWGYRNQRAPHSGWIARFKDLHARPAISVVALGLTGQTDFLGGETESTYVLDERTQLVAGFRFTGDLDYPANNRHRYELAERIALRERPRPLEERASAALRASYRQARQTGNGTSLVRYPRSGIGSALQTLGTMFFLDLPMRITYVNYGNFDTHSSQGGVQGDHADQLFDLDQAIAAYAADLAAQGRWTKTAIAIFSEFGRRNQENASGTDHGDGSVMIVVGGNVRGGLYGPDLTDAMLRQPVLPSAVDFRSVYAALLEQHFAVESGSVFREAYVRTPLTLML
jgi:uncharacterized protein (DUF1501 family)